MNQLCNDTHVLCLFYDPSWRSTDHYLVNAVVKLLPLAWLKTEEKSTLQPVAFNSVHERCKSLMFWPITNHLSWKYFCLYEMNLPTIDKHPSRWTELGERRKVWRNRFLASLDGPSDVILAIFISISSFLAGECFILGARWSNDE